jgi:choline dehydrogenase-like flavoprotein
MLREEFDAVIVGSGITGGWAAKRFTEHGRRVAVVEAGAQSAMASLPAGDNPIQSRCYAYSPHTAPYFIDDHANPYTHATGRPFVWIRGGVLGGRSLLWAGQCYRFSDMDLKAASLDGVGDDWPIGVDELAPYYGAVERFIGVRGRAAGLPHLPDGDYLPVEDFGPEQERLAEAVAQMGSQLIPARLAVRQLAGDERCLHCGHTGKGCLGYVGSPHSTLRAAERTGRLRLYCDTLATRVVIDGRGKACRVDTIEKLSGERRRISAPKIFLCASALESTRLLLNSATPDHPRGIGNSSGTLGQHLMDHISMAVTGLYKPRSSTWREELGTPRLLYIPRWQNLGRRTSTYRRGYAFQVVLGTADALIDRSDPLCASGTRTTRDLPPALSHAKQMIVLQLSGFGEMLPDSSNAVRIDRSGKTDKWNTSVLEIDCRHGANDAALFADMLRSAKAIVEALGGTTLKLPTAPFPPGLAIHESGTCRLGTDPARSVLDRFNHCHDVENLFVTDAASFPSIGTQNPALTLMALTMRACDHAMGLTAQPAVA